MYAHMVTSVEGFNSLGDVAPEVITQSQNPPIELLGIYNTCPREKKLLLVQNHEVFI